MKVNRKSRYDQSNTVVVVNTEYDYSEIAELQPSYLIVPPVHLA
jgi:hypothetical protein